jgi:hypothetical protein
MPHSTRRRLRRENRERRLKEQALQQVQDEDHQALQQDDHQALQQVQDEDHQALQQDDHQALRQVGDQALRQEGDEDEQERLSIRFTRLFAMNYVEFKALRGPMPCRAEQLLDVDCLKELSAWGFSYYPRLPASLARNEELVKTLLQRHGTHILSQIMWRYRHYDPVSEVGKLLVRLAADRPESMKESYTSNKAFILDVIKLNAYAFKYSDYVLMSDVDFVLACMMENIQVGQHTNSALFKSLTTKEDVRTAIDARAYASTRALDDAGSHQDMFKETDDDSDVDNYGGLRYSDGYPDDDYEGCGGYGFNGWCAEYEN